MDKIIEVKIVGWVQVCALGAIMAIGFLLNQAEIRLNSRLNRNVLEQQQKELESVKTQILIQQQQQKQFCLQYEFDMDRYFRTRPETQGHPWVCGVNLN